MFSIQVFAEQHSLVLRKDSCGDALILGKRNGKRREDSCHVYQDGERLGVCFMLTTPRKWGFARRALEAVGCQLKQNGNTEGTLIFNPSVSAQVSAVIRIAGLRRVRKPSPAQLESLQAVRASRAA